MQSEKQWNLDAVLLFVAGLMISFALGVFGTLIVTKFGNLPDPQVKFYGFVVGTVSLHGVALILTHFLLQAHRLTWPEFLGLKGPHLPKAALVALGVALLALPPALGLNELSRQFIVWIHGSANPQPTMEVLENSVGLWQRIWFGMSAIIVAPLAEEILFRAILYRTLCQLGPRRRALLISALVFGIFHISLVSFVPLTVLAIILTVLYDKTDNLMAPIIAHSLFNAANFFYFIYQTSARAG